MAAVIYSAISITMITFAEESTISTITMEVSPSSGDITSDILVTVRGVPYICGGQLRRLYVYYDDKNVVSGQVPTDTGGRATWDASIRVPNEKPFSDLGQHTVRVVVEASDGTTASASTTFTIVNYIAPPEWWRDLPSEFLEMIKGPKGDTGATGIQGPKGEPGVSAPIEYIYGSAGLSLIAIIIAIIAITRKKKPVFKQGTRGRVPSSPPRGCPRRV